MSLSEKLQKLKSQQQMSIQTISDKSGIPIGTVKRIFSGKTTDPGYATVCCILAAMDTGSETAAELYKDVSTETAGSPQRTIRALLTFTNALSKLKTNGFAFC